MPEMRVVKGSLTKMSKGPSKTATNDLLSPLEWSGLHAKDFFRCQENMTVFRCKLSDSQVLCVHNPLRYTVVAVDKLRERVRKGNSHECNRTSNIYTWREHITGWHSSGGRYVCAFGEGAESD